PADGQPATRLSHAVNIVTLSNWIVYVSRNVLVEGTAAKSKHHVDDRNIDHTTQPPAGILRILHTRQVPAHTAVEVMAVWILQNIFDESAHGAGTVQGTLRAAQYFDAFQVVGQQVELEAVGKCIQATRANRGVVDVGAHRGSRTQRSDAAQGDCRLARSAPGVDL